MPYINSKLISLIKKYSEEWLEKIPAYMGNLSGVVVTGIAGIDWVRLTNGQEIKVINRTAPQVFDTKVIIGKSKTMPNIYQVVNVRETYLIPSSGFITAHAEQHQYPNFDTVFADRKQVLQLTVLVNQEKDFTVTIYGAITKTRSQWALVETQDVDLTSHIPSAGFIYAVLEINGSGVVSVNTSGPVAASLVEASDVGTYIPVPASFDKVPLAAILLYESMASIVDDDIRVLFPIETSYMVDDASFIGFLSGVTTIQEAFEALDIHEHATGFVFDDSEGDPADVTTGFPTDGISSFAARRDHVHHHDVPHEHGLDRWNGISGQTVFELSELAFSLSEVILDGVEEDPFVYSLSEDGTQIILDSGLSVDMIVVAHYEILGM